MHWKREKRKTKKVLNKTAKHRRKRKEKERHKAQAKKHSTPKNNKNRKEQPKRGSKTPRAWGEMDAQRGGGGTPRKQINDGRQTSSYKHKQTNKPTACPRGALAGDKPERVRAENMKCVNWTILIATTRLTFFSLFRRPCSGSLAAWRLR